MRRSPRLPKRFPVGTKYILESYGSFVRRYIEYPSRRRIELETRKALFPVAASTAVLCQSLVLTSSIQSLQKFKAKFDLLFYESLLGADEGTEERIRTDSI